MYNSEACQKDNKDTVKKLEKLKSKTAKLDALKENIKIRVIGFGWIEDCHITWSHKKNPRPVSELAKHLEWIIGWEKEKKLPKKPHITAPARRKDALL